MSSVSSSFFGSLRVGMIFVRTATLCLVSHIWVASSNGFCEVL